MIKFNHKADNRLEAIGFTGTEDISKTLTKATTKIIGGDHKFTEKEKVALIDYSIIDKTPVLGAMFEDLLGKEGEFDKPSQVIEYLYTAISNDETYANLAGCILVDKMPGMLQELLRELV
jgi:hypothetical protein